MRKGRNLNCRYGDLNTSTKLFTRSAIKFSVRLGANGKHQWSKNNQNEEKREQLHRFSTYRERHPSACSPSRSVARHRRALETPQNFKKHFSRSNGFHCTEIHTGSYWKDRVNTPSDWQLGISLIGWLIRNAAKPSRLSGGFSFLIFLIFIPAHAVASLSA